MHNNVFAMVKYARPLWNGTGSPSVRAVLLGKWYVSSSPCPPFGVRYFCLLNFVFIGEPQTNCIQRVLC